MVVRSGKNELDFIKMVGRGSISFVEETVSTKIRVRKTKAVFMESVREVLGS